MKRLLKKLSAKFSIVHSQFSILQKGFTLIELLVVIAVLGVLAAIVLLAVNPGEQLARARDTNRISAVTQLGRTLQAYFTAQGGTFSGVPNGTVPATPIDWMSPLVVSNDLKVRPANPGWTTAPTTNCDGQYREANAATIPVAVAISNGNAGGYCYRTNGTTDSIVYARLEATLNNGKCTGVGVVAWSVFSTADARSGVVCSSTEPAVGTQIFLP